MADRKNRGESLDAVRKRAEGDGATLTEDDVEYLLRATSRNFATLTGTEAAKLLVEVAERRPALIARRLESLVAVVAENNSTREGALIWQNLLNALRAALEHADTRSSDRYEVVVELSDLLTHSKRVRSKGIAIITSILSDVSRGSKTYQRLDDWLTPDIDIELGQLSPSVIETVEALVAGKDIRTLREGATDHEEVELARAVCLVYRLTPLRFDDEAELAALLSLLTHGDKGVRQSMASLHCDIVDSDVRYPLTARTFRRAITAVEQGEHEVGRAAVAIVEQFAANASTVIVTDDLLAALASAADHESDPVREAVAAVATELDDSAPALETLDDESVAHLLALRRTPDPTAETAVSTLLETALRADAELVSRALEVDPSVAPQAAAFLLARVTVPEFRQPAVRELQVVAETAPRELDSGVTTLGTAFEAGDDSVREQTCEILAAIGTNEAVERLRAIAEEAEDPDMRSTVESALDQAERDTVGAEPAADPGTKPEAGTQSGAKSQSWTGAETGAQTNTEIAAAAAIASGPPKSVPGVAMVDIDYEALSNEEPLGAGGNADVWLSRLRRNGQQVSLAIKEPRVAGTLHTDRVERLLSEAETWNKLDDHDHIVGVVDYGSQPLPWIAMEYMDGGHLGERAGQMGIQQALWTAIAVTDGVHHAHRHGVAHLDLKPENVLFRTVEDAWDVPKVGDWGLSKHLLEHSKSVEGLSPQYAAPEQFDESYGPTDDITDVYQLGAVFYELFTGQPPFEGRPTQVMRAVMDEKPTPPSDLVDVPQGLDEVLLTALAKQKADRYESVILLRNALEDIFDAS